MFSWLVLTLIVLAAVVRQLWRGMASDVIAAWLIVAVARDLPKLSPETLRILPDLVRALRSHRME